MKNNMACLFSILITILILGNVSFGRVADSVTPQFDQTEARFTQITNEAGSFFKQGLFNMRENRRAQAREDFNKSVEVFLMSGVNVNLN